MVVRCLATSLLVFGLLVAACAAPAPRLASPVPVDRARAAVAAAERGEADAIYRLVELLDDADGGVRMYAILALRRLTGHTYGFVYHGTLAERSAAIERWRTALQEGRVKVAGAQHAADGASQAATSGE